MKRFTAVIHRGEPDEKSGFHRPKLPRTLSTRNVARYKSALRAYDRKRIAARAASPAEIERENSIVPMPRRPVRILNFPETETRA